MSMVVEISDAVIEAMVRAHDKEEAAMMGEPDPWADDFPQAQMADRIFCMRLALEVLERHLNTEPRR